MISEYSPRSTAENMSVPSISYYENVESKKCDAHFQKDFDELPRIYSQKFCSGSYAEKRPSANSEIFMAIKAAQKLEMNVGANHTLSSTKGCCFSSHYIQNHHLIPTNDNFRSPDPQTWNQYPDSGAAKSKFFISPRGASTSCEITQAYRRTSSWPVVFSLELLDSVRGLSLPLAASTVGVSATAFKKACRRLGVTRWEYRRGPGRASSKNVARPRGPATSRPGRVSRLRCTPSLCQCAGSSAGEDVDMQLAGVGTADCETKELADWLRGEVAEVGSVAVAEPEDDALVLQMLALRWPLTTAVPALD